RRIWQHQPDTALLLIGDPKQAIYAFRGADIFTYMKARSEVSASRTSAASWRLRTSTLISDARTGLDVLPLTSCAAPDCPAL
ncbi:UvrD-helicase domain-containing protein, partial [Citrobacter braakii]|uniref:UvrD-helicase domain-containing protein n=1 Tax=Citrobacter braakii TaxID=57706 RepID=UPI00379409DB